MTKQGTILTHARTHSVALPIFPVKGFFEKIFYELEGVPYLFYDSRGAPLLRFMRRRRLIE